LPVKVVNACISNDHADEEIIMTTFWISFSDPEASADERFLGVAIFDMDESDGEKSTAEIIRECWRLGINPGGQASVQEVPAMPEQFKNRLIKDDGTLLALGSKGRHKANLS
jgi:hypothetical protein